MKLAILLARSSVDPSRASVVQVPMPYDQAAKIFKDHVARREMPDGCAKAGLNILELWISDGRRKTKRISDGAPAAQPAPAAAAPVVKKPAATPEPAVTTPAPAASTGDPVTKMAARLSAGEAVTTEDLEALTVPQLRALAAGFAIEIPEGSAKDDIIVLILASD